MLPKKKRWTNAIQHTAPMVSSAHLPSGMPNLNNDQAMKNPVSPQLQGCQASPVTGSAGKSVPYYSSSAGFYQPLNTFGPEAVSPAAAKPGVGSLHQAKYSTTANSLRPAVPANEPASNCELADAQPSLLLQIPREYFTSFLRMAASGRSDYDLSAISQLTEASSAFKGVLYDQNALSQLDSGNIRLPYHAPISATVSEQCTGSGSNSLAVTSKRSPEPPKNNFNTGGNRIFPTSRPGTGNQVSEPQAFCTPISPSVQRFSPHRLPSSGSNSSCDHLLSSRHSPSSSRVWIHSQVHGEHTSGVVKSGAVLPTSSPTSLLPLWDGNPSTLLSALGNGIAADRMQCSSDTANYPISLNVSGNGGATSALEVGLLSTAKSLNATDYPIRPKSSIDSSCLAGSTSRSHSLMSPLSQNSQLPPICHKPGVPGNFDLANRVCFSLPGDHSTSRPNHAQHLATWMSSQDTQASEAPECTGGRGLDVVADSRLAILQDAKMTALSVGWPNASTASLTSMQSPTFLGSNASPKLSTPSCKSSNRTRPAPHPSTTCFSVLNTPAIPTGLVSTSLVSSAAPSSRLLSTPSLAPRFPPPHPSAGNRLPPCCSPSSGKPLHYYHHAPAGQSVLHGGAGPGNNSRLPLGGVPIFSSTSTLAPPLSPVPSMQQVDSGSVSPAPPPPPTSRWHTDRLPSAGQLGNYQTGDPPNPHTAPSPNKECRSPKFYHRPQANPVHSLTSSGTTTSFSSSNTNHWLLVPNLSSDSVEQTRPPLSKPIPSTSGGGKPCVPAAVEDGFMSESRSVMSLKKRFLQRYEADCTGETAKPGHSRDTPAPAVKRERLAHSHISPPPATTTTSQNETKMPCDPTADSKQTSTAGINCPDSSTKAARKASAGAVLDTQGKNSADSVAPTNANSVENGDLGGQFKSGNCLGSRGYKKESASQGETVGRSRKTCMARPTSSSHSSSSSPSSARRCRVQAPSEVAPTSNNPRRRRMAAINGNLLTMVAARVHRSTSSSGSSSGTTTSCRRVRKARGAPRHSAGESGSSSGAEEEEGGSTSSRRYRQHGERKERKTKRAAALLVSAATLTAKRPRLSKQSKESDGEKVVVAAAHRSRGKDRLKHASSEAVLARTMFNHTSLPEDEANEAEYEDDGEMTSVSTEDTANLCVSGKNSVPGTPRVVAGSELASVTVEESKSLEDLADQVPGPPDLLQLTKHSLYLPHTLDHYKSSQMTFIQLVSCNDPGLKQVPKCRACRQLKGMPHFEADLHALSGGTCGDSASQSDAESLSSTTTWTLTRPDGSGKETSVNSAGNSHQQSGTSFKRPSSARHPTSHRSDRDRRRTKAFSKSAAGAKPSGLNPEPCDRPSGKVERSKQRRTAALSQSSVFCRFWGFRKLCFNNRGVLKIADFCQSSEASAGDRSLWEMHYPVFPPLSPEAARYILQRAGTLFCHLLRQELLLLTGHHKGGSACETGAGKPTSLSHGNSRLKNGVRRTPDANGSSCAGLPKSAAQSIAWKRPVKGVREMCDVCETALFNTHWVCAKCGYSVCVHCCDEAKVRVCQPASKPDSQDQGKVSMVDSCPTDDKPAGGSRNKQNRARAGPAGWVSCTTTRQNHDAGRLMLTSLLPATTVGTLLHRLHRIANRYRVRLDCGCPSAQGGGHFSSLPTRDVGRGDDSLNLLASLALKGNDLKTSLSSNEDEDDGQVKRATGCSDSAASFRSWIYKPDPTTSCLAMTLKNSQTELNGEPVSALDNTSRSTLPLRHAISRKYRVLRLTQPNHANNLEAFQREWRRSRPVIVSGCQANFDPQLWRPQRFAEDFGQLRTVLVDCATGVELTRYPLRTFWDGFERKNKRLVSKDGRALCLKLKDWPTMDDFAELQPERFQDLMTHLPLPIYTCRDGELNLASRLPSFFVCPDLGPKLYVAYGTGGSRSMGTTNLHVDMADAVNLILYVGHPVDSVEESSANAEAVLTVIRQANVDASFIERTSAWMRRHLPGSTFSGTRSSSGDQVLDVEEADCGPPGALWHIFLPSDMSALRDFLTRITEEETGAPLEPGSDPIHDQQIYLDQPMLDRLYAFTGILPCTLVQFHGDAIFIPAGAAHQVRNLNSCIKAAVDFVSPEHLNRCLQLSDQFRRLSATHQNREDKLQVKNMLFHGVKDALSVLLMSTGTGRDRKTRVDDDISTAEGRPCQTGGHLSSRDDGDLKASEEYSLVVDHSRLDSEDDRVYSSP